MIHSQYRLRWQESRINGGLSQENTNPPYFYNKKEPQGGSFLIECLRLFLLSIFTAALLIIMVSLYNSSLIVIANFSGFIKTTITVMMGFGIANGIGNVDESIIKENDSFLFRQTASILSMISSFF